ncbi:hypothetical protein V5O48_009617 [Marasmius crinis-equi]|uniref:Carboxylic ester hydrolase n=1 Tax=Marasmius crinis-equi TaxID=585013 RepID=A0ABR3FAP3_9AGAR
MSPQPPNTHLHDELRQSDERVVVETKYGTVKGGRAVNGAGVFLEIPYALPPGRWEDPKPLPHGFRYTEGKEYIREARYCAQPKNDGQARGTRAFYIYKVGFGEASENPLFLNIVTPPAFPNSSKGSWPVKVYIHGGFLQFGSPHGLSHQAQYVSARPGKEAVHVNIGYRLSVFGFLASKDQRLTGNYGFKDQWLALQWVKANINGFGGDPENIQILGLSAGAHSIHQLLHHASQLPEGEKAPFVSAIMRSNAIATTPKTPTELQPQYDALCAALDLDPSSPETLSSLKDPSKVTAEKLCQLIETDKLGIPYGTFRGAFEGSWVREDQDLMGYQSSGSLGKNLLQRGVRNVVIGDLTEEWYLYSIAHDHINSRDDVRSNLLRYYRETEVDRMMSGREPVKGDWVRLFGEILSDWQVHIPVRMFATDMAKVGFPVLRYVIKWTPEKARESVEGYVTHGTDSSLWHYRLPSLNPTDVQVADSWLDRIDEELAKIEGGRNLSFLKDTSQVLVLKEDQTIDWMADDLWFKRVASAML